MASITSLITPGVKTRSLGIIMDRTKTFENYKVEKRRREERFGNKFPGKKIKNDLDRSVTNIDQNQRLIDEKNLHDTPGKHDSSEHNSSNSTHAPGWTELYQDTLDRLQETEKLYKEFLSLKEQRIKKQFGNQSSLDARLEDVCRQATTKLSHCESNIAQIGPSKYQDDNDGENPKVRKNLQKALASRVQEQAKLFRAQEKALYDFLVKLNGDKGEETNTLNKKNEFFEDKDQADMMEELHEQRDEQVNKLVGTLNKLAQVFKQMNDLVIEQGTVLDRIDYNMEQTLFHTKKGTEQLVKANIAQATGFAAKCRKILMVLIMIFTFILVLKYTS